jgi:hypothetical protein
MDPDQEDRAVQVALLHHLLDVHPALLSQSDLIRELAGGTEDQTHHRDSVERAVSDLVKLGLLRYLGDYVLPTRPAIYGRLLGDP